MIDTTSHVRAQAPLAGVVMCCTSITPEERGRLADVATQMGATHKFDLTSDVTHLIVGNIDTPKYRYVARERPDVRVLLPRWVEAVRESWMEGGETDVAKLEEAHKVPTFHGLRVCVTGFDNSAQRQILVDTLEKYGAEYHGDLTKAVTHLIVAKPIGKKFEYARQWQIHCVCLEWLDDSVVRGMALEEALYNPLLPQEERGKGAFVSSMAAPAQPKKRTGDDLLDNHKRKLRRTASAKFGSQNEGIWADITAVTSDTRRRSEGQWEDIHTKNQESESQSDKPQLPSLGLGTSMLGAAKQKDTTVPLTTTSEANLKQGIFQRRVVYLHGFDSKKVKILGDHLEPNGAHLVRSIDDFEQHSLHDLEQGFLVVPQEVSLDSLPPLPEPAKRLLKVTNWWVEKCLHRKDLINPLEDPTCRPFPYPQIEGFDKLAIASTGFSNIDLLHLSKTVKFLGASYEEYLKPETTVLICNTAKGSTAKMKYAYERAIPAVTYDWILQSIETGIKQDISEYLLQSHRDTQSSGATSTKQLSEEERTKLMNRSRDMAAEDRRRHQVATLAKQEKSQSTSKVLRQVGLDGAADGSQTQPDLTLSMDSGSAPLKEISPNSPCRRPSASSKSSSSDKRSHTTEEDGDPKYAALELPPSTNTIAALLNKNKSREAPSNGPSLPNGPRRRRGLLGRASSLNSNASRGGSPALNLDPTGDEEQEGQDKYSYEEPLASQSLTYDDPDAQRARELMMKRIGGKIEVDTGRVQSVGVVTDVKPLREEGAAGKVGRRSRRG